jgi:predicted ATPase/class 3 adenylate cyclase
MRDLPTGTITFLLTDVEGSSSLWERAPEAARSALERHDAIIESIVDREGGVVVRPRGEGDSRFAVFARASDSIAAACAIQCALVAEFWLRSPSLRVRIALHSGESDVRQGDYYGNAVNRCARLRLIAHGGQVLISSVTAVLVGSVLPEGATLKDLGHHRLKDLTEPEHVFQLVHAELPTDFPRPPSLDTHSHNLPVQPTALVGRESEVDAVKALLLTPSTRLLTLTGAGGVGKTRVALQVAAEVLEQFADGVFWVPLAALTESDLVVPAIAQTLMIQEEPDTSLLETLSNALRRRTMLLVLDNFEQIRGAAEAVVALSERCVSLKVLVTSRARLRVYGELEYPLPPLSLPKAPWPEPERLAQYDAVRLFIDRARAAQPDFHVTNESAPAVAEICTRLDGIALAIELAAARIKLLTPDALLARLDQRLKLLVGGPRDRPARQQTLRGTIDWSYALLGAEQQALFRNLSVFVGGFSLDGADAVWRAAAPVHELDALDGLSDLVDQSLIRPLPRVSGESRYAMLETVREYAVEQLASHGEAGNARRAHADFYIALGEQAALDLTAGAQHAMWLEKLDDDKDNLRMALRWCMEAGDADRGVQLGGAVWRYWFLRGALSVGRDWLHSIVTLAEQAKDSGLRARALTGAGVIAIWQHDYTAARVLLEQSLALGRALGDQSRIAASLHNLAALAVMTGEHDKAWALLEQALAVARSTHDQRREALTLSLMAGFLREQGDYTTALSMNTESLVAYKALGDQTGIAVAVGQQSLSALGAGNLAAAESFGQAAIKLARDAGDEGTLASCLLDLALVRLGQGDHVSARALCRESIVVANQLPELNRIVNCLGVLASVAADEGQAGRALFLYGAASTTSRNRVTLFKTLGFDRYIRETWESKAWAAIDHDAGMHAFAAGGELTPAQAYAYALDECAKS